MKNLAGRKIFGWFTTALLILVIAGCKSTPEGTTTLHIDKADFKSDTGLLEVRNDTSVDMALFAGRVERGIFLGTIQSFGVQRFDIAKIPDISRKGVFRLRTTSGERYRQKRGHLSEEDVVYTALVVYDLDAPEDKARVSIPEKIDSTQTYSVYMSNNSRFILELRLDSLNADSIVTLLPLERNKKLWLIPDERGMPYMFFPVYVYVDGRTNEVKSLLDPNLRGFPEAPAPEGSDARLLNFDVSRSEFPQYEVGFIQITNDTNTSLRFLYGTTPLTRVMMVNSGSVDTFGLICNAGADGQTYTNLSLDFGMGVGKSIKLNPITIKPGYVYDLTITEVNGNIAYNIGESGRKTFDEDSCIVLFGE